MTQEEKAKAYDEALERARKIHNETEFDYEKGMVEEIFPKLKESEDEKIRKELLESFKYQQRESRTDKEWLNGIKLSEVVAWLEKQGEQKPFDYEHATIIQKDFAPKQEWSEEDDKSFEECCGAVWATDYYTWDDKEKICDWLKSLKERIGWKPSKEHMKALHDLNLTGKISYAGQGQVLIELYNDLKKLKE